MRYIDVNRQEMPDNFNKDDYTIAEATIAKDGAYDTIDNVTKFFLNQDDYEKVYMCYPKVENENIISPIEETLIEHDQALCDLYEILNNAGLA
jgi:hypothetical protein